MENTVLHQSTYIITDFSVTGSNEQIHSAIGRKGLQKMSTKKSMELRYNVSSIQKTFIGKDVRETTK